MATSLKQFRQQLVASGLISSEKLKDVLETLDPGTFRTEQLATALIQSGKLTKYQAQMIAQGKGQSLTLGVYVIKDKIGAGGMGQVYLAEHQRMKREVALKILPPEMVKNADAVQRFHREVQAAAKLNHPNIVTAYDANEEQGTHFLVMEHVQGKDLSATVKQRGSFHIELALDVIRQAAEGLAYAHEKGIIHRDIKPANLLLDEEGTLKILDMGLARIDSPGDADDGDGLTSTGMVMGTVDYMAPEQAMDTHSATAQSDIYSLGCTLFYLLTGRSLFVENTIMKKLMALQTEPAPSLISCRREVGPEVEQLYQKMVAKKVEDRLTSMREVVAAIEQCRSALTITEGSSPHMLTADSALQKFLQDQGSSNEPTFVQPEETIKDDEPPPETMQSGFLSDTMSSVNPAAATIAGRPLRSGGVARNKKLWIGLGGGLAGLLLLGFIIKITSPDDKTTAVEDLKDPQAIINNDGNVDANLPEKRSTTPTANSALSFNGGDDYVDLPTLNYDGTHDLTFEARIELEQVDNTRINLFTLHGTGFFGISRESAGWNISGAPRRNGKTYIFEGHPEDYDRSIHIAVTLQSGTPRVFIDGQERREVANATWRLPNATGAVIGKQFSNHQPIPNPGPGRISELRLSKTIRYDKDFTPPTQFDDEPDTLALYHFDEGEGDVLRDSSGEGRHGKIVGAQWVRSVESARAPSTNYALEFDGKSTYARTPTLKFQEGQPWTIEGWVTPLGRPLQPNHAVFIENPRINLALAAGQADGPRWSALSSPKSELTNRFHRSDQPVIINEPTHLALVNNGESVRLYVNGQPQKGIVAEQLVDQKGSLNIGPQNPAIFPKISGFYGMLDEIRVSDVARYSESFQPLKRFSTDKDTIALYHFDEGTGETFQDSSGKGNHGEIIGAKWVDITPSSKQALRFDGRTSYVDLPTLNYDGSHPITIEAIVRAEDVSESMHIVSNVEGGGVGLLYQDGDWQFVAQEEGGYVKARLPAEETIGGYVNLAGVYDGKTVKLFVNGKLKNSLPASSNFHASNAHFVIGANPGENLSVHESKKTAGNNYYQLFNGLIKEIRISRAARYAEDYVPAEQLSKDESTWALYHFDEGRGQRLKDSSDEGNHGEIVGAEWVEVNAESTTNAASTNPDRAAAEWVLGIGGSIVTDAGNFEAVNELPQASFQIVSIDLKNNQQVTDDDLQRFQELTNLNELRLNRTPVTDAGLEHLRGLKSLTDLDLMGTQITGLEPLKGLENLTFLNLSNTQISSLEALQGLTNLGALNLDHIPISNLDVKPLQGLTKLKTLHLASNRIDDTALALLKGLTSLNTLSLTGTPITDAGLEHLKGLTNLGELRIGSTEIRGTGLVHLKGLTKLRSLNLNFSPVSDAGLEQLQQLSTLKSLNLLGTKLSAQSIADLKKALPACKIEHNTFEKMTTSPLSGIVPHPENVEGMRWQIVPRRPLSGIADWGLNGIAVRDDVYVRLYDKHTHQLTSVIEVCSGQDSQGVSALCWSPDGRWLAIGTRPAKVSGVSEIVLWDSRSSEISYRFDAGPATVSDFAWTKDNQQLAIGTSWGDPIIRVWNVGTQLILEIPCPIDGVGNIEWISENNKLAVINYKMGNLVTIDVKSHELERSPIRTMGIFAFSPDQKQMAIRKRSSDQNQKEIPFVEVIDVESQEVVTTLGNQLQHWANQLVWSPDGKSLATPSQNAHVWVFDWQAGNAIWSGYIHSPARQACWSPDGKSLLCMGENRNLYLYEVGGSPHYAKTVIPAFSARSAGWLRISPFDSRLAFTDHYDRAVKIVDSRGFLQQAPQTDVKLPVRSLTWHPLKPLLATASEDHQIQFWDSEGQLVSALEQYEGEVHAISWNPEGTIFVVAGKENISFWNQDQDLIISSDIPTNIRTFDWQPEGKLLAGRGADNSQIFWNSEGRIVQTIERSSSPLIWQKFSPDGQHLAVATLNGTVQFYELNAESKLTRLEDPVIHTGDNQLYAVAWSHDSKQIVTSGNKNQLLIWSETEEEPQKFESVFHTRITNILWPEENGELIVADGMGRIHSLDLASGKRTRVSTLLPNSQFATFDARGTIISATPEAERELLYLLEREPDRSLEVLTPEQFDEQFDLLH